MTKQEQIAKMAVMACHRNPSAKTMEECLDCPFKVKSCNQYELAEALYNAGYKQEKEVVKEILTKYKSCFHKLIFEKIVKEYGIELE